MADRPRALLITNHGYAGVEVPVGGAPDTGGQVFYVNSLALALQELGYSVTIAARGGFPHFGSDRLREGEEQLAEHVRYLYVPGGGDAFIRKEDIAPALPAQLDWLEAFVGQQARAAGCAPWEVYRLINTHYWDAAVLGVGLAQRWGVDRHVWTPHSLGALKEDNYRGKPPRVVEPLRFAERKAEERAICAGTRRFASTSDEIGQWLRSYYGVPAERIFDFPPCVDMSVFRPRSDDELDATVAWLAGRTGWDPAALRGGELVFEASRNDTTKRKDLVLRAFARAAAERPAARLFVAGGPDNDVQRQLRAIRDADPVLRRQAHLFEGKLPDEHLGPLFSLAGIYATPSEMEGFGMSAAQAAAAGSTLVCSGLVPFAVQYAARAAHIVAAGDELGFAAALEALLADPDERARRGRALVEATRALDWVAVTRAFLGFLDLA